MKLVLVREGGDKEFDVQEGTNLIGRWDPDASSFPEIDLEELDPDAKISRKHAMVTRSGTSLILEDLGSLNGTFAMDSSTKRESKLEPGTKLSLKVGDQFVVGKLLFKVED